MAMGDSELHGRGQAGIELAGEQVLEHLLGDGREPKLPLCREKQYCKIEEGISALIA